MPSAQFDKLCQFVVYIFDPPEESTRRLYLDSTPSWTRESSYQDELLKLWDECPERLSISSALVLRDKILSWIRTGTERFTFNPNESELNPESELDGFMRLCEEMISHSHSSVPQS